jgi:hypothetical protein
MVCPAAEATGQKLVRKSRSSQLQGVAPLTSPWCLAAVAGDVTLDPSMGFGPLQGPLISAPNRRCHTGELPFQQAEARLPDRPGLRTLQQAATPSNRRNPSRNCPALTQQHGRNRAARAMTTKQGAEAESSRTPFQRDSQIPESCSNEPTAEAATSAGAVPPKSIRNSMS